MDDQKKVLEMIEKGQITAAEGMELLNALNKSAEEQNDNSVTALIRTDRTGAPDEQHRFRAGH